MINYLEEIKDMNNLLTTNEGHFVKYVNTKMFHIRFCVICGNYLDLKDSNDLLLNEIRCKCNYKDFLFDQYKESIVSWPNHYGGDDFDDSFENMDDCHPALKLYMIRIALFSMFNKKNIDVLLDNNDIMDNIYDYL